MNELLKRTTRSSKKFLSFLFLTFVMSLLFVQEARSTEAKSVTLYDREERREIVQDGKKFNYLVRYSLNPHGERQVDIALIEAHWLAKDTNLIVLSGRDTNSDQMIDAWFFSEGAIVHSVKRTALSEDAWPTAKDILVEFSLDEGRWLSSLVARELFKSMFLTIQGELESAEKIEQMQMDLLDLEYRLQSLEDGKEDPLLIHELKRISEQGWEKLLDQVTRGQIEERHQRLMGDVALFVGGASIARGARFFIGKALSSATLKAMKGNLRYTIEKHKLWRQNIASRIAARSSSKGLGGVLGKVFKGGVGIASRSILHIKTEKEALSWLSRQSYVSGTLKGVASMVKQAAAASADRRGYILTSQTIQLAVESYTRGYWTFSDMPLVLDRPVASTQEFIQQVANDKGLLQNFGYMTLQTTFLSGATESMLRNNVGIKTRFAVCSIITLIDSSTVNVLVQGRTDVPRIAFDTAWEIFVGGSQIQFDMKMLRWANALADKYKSPKLRLVGYLLGSIDQAAGYAGYAKVSSHFFESKDLTVMPPVVLVPVLAPQ